MNKIPPYIICTSSYRTDTTYFPKGYVEYLSLSNFIRNTDNWRRATWEEVEEYKKGNTPDTVQKYNEDQKIGSGLWQQY